MTNQTEQEERQYLGTIKGKLKEALEKLDKDLARQSREMQENKAYLYENKGDMDHAEKVSVRESIQKNALVGESAVKKKERLTKLKQSPYFGRITTIT